ncbi:hypothetical protein BYT27DRAFT_7095019 [Phlegmacium glaucopus]|nr:hypothetical protein BYT27DRAFT_7095019 [Phlegmacium glaucopus]
MTEYTTSSHAFREYMSARERTARWVQNHSPIEDEFYSPSLPPSVIDGLVPSSPPSEADSSYSTPPKMVLRYNDGRPDVPIPHPGSMGKPGSRIDSPAFKPSYSHRHDHESRVPEEIRILPSSGDVPTSSTSSRHTRSKSLPRSSDHHRPPAPDVPFIPPPHMQTQSPYYGQRPLPMGSQGISPPPQQVSFAQPTHPWPPRHGHPKHAPPAIIYAPSHHSQRPHYAPPAMFHHPPQMGPNGMIYSHSAPPAYPTPYGGVTPHRHTSSAHDIRGPNGLDPSHTRSLGRSTRINPTSSSTSLTSHNSGSTYYVLPAHGQKVHVINPSPEQSIVTATSTTKSPTSPFAQTFGKKPFFQRLFGFAKFSTAGSSRASSNGGGKLYRRHSLGTSRNTGDEQSQ